MKTDYSNRAMQSNVAVGDFKRSHKPQNTCKICEESDERTLAGMDWCARCVKHSFAPYEEKSIA